MGGNLSKYENEYLSIKFSAETEFCKIDPRLASVSPLPPTLSLSLRLSAELGWPLLRISRRRRKPAVNVNILVNILLA
jgi:hypothetical protein